MEFKTVLTICPYCGCGCGLLLEVLDGKIVGTLPSKTSPVNEGKLCVKGWTVHEFVTSPNRLTKPMVRKGDTLEDSSWDEALNLAATRLKEIKEKFGPDSIGVLTSAKCTNEENYLLQKFTRAAIGTNNIDHCARLWHSSTVAGLAASFGSGAMTNSIEEIEGADCILIIGSNTSVAHPLIATRVFRAKARGAKVIVADPRKIPIVLQSDLHLRQNLGTDVALINGLMHIILKKGWQDQAFIDERTENFEELKKVVENYPPEKVSEITGIPVADLEKAAGYYAKAERATILYTMGITQHTTGVDNVKSLANLAMLTGNLGKEFTGINPLRGQNNVQGACDMGGLPNVYTGYQAVTDQAVRQKFEEAWGAKLPDKIGLTATEMFPAVLDGKMKAIIILGENPVVSDADSLHVEKALKALDFLLVIDIFKTPTTDLAHVVLPGAAFAEKEGTFSNTERRVQLLRKAVEPPGESKPDWQIIQELSNRFGYPMDYASPHAIMEEIAKLTPSYGGITYDRLQADGLQWPCPNTEHPGTKFLHQGRFTRGKGLFSAIEYKPAAETADEEYPFQLTTGRVHVHYHTGTMTRNSPSLEREIKECFLEMNPEDASEIGIADGEWVIVESRRGSVSTKVKLTRSVNKKAVFMPFHFLESRANILTNPIFDPIAKIPEFKVCAVKIEKTGTKSNQSITPPVY